MLDEEFLDAKRRLSVPAGGPNGMPRRRFLQALGVGAGAAVTAAQLIPRLEAFGVASTAPDDGILVLVQLDGGNDGLNTVIPFADARYRQLRPSLKYDAPGSGANACLDIGSPTTGLHPSLAKLRTRYQNGQVAIVRGVGYTPPDLSHFSSMGYWMQGWKDAPPNNYANGWVGRFMDALPGAESASLLGVVLGSSVPLHMVGSVARAAGLPMSLGDAFGLSTDPTQTRLYDAISTFDDQPSQLGTWGDNYAKAAAATMDLAKRIQPAYSPAVDGEDLVRKLTLVARLINVDLGTRVFNVSIGNFDNHADQRGTHAAQLQELDDGIDALFANLDPRFRSRVVLLTFSEFGRRPGENDSLGTDHGTANPNILVGASVKGGLYGAQPALTVNGLDGNGNLKYAVDFRNVYAEVLQEWMGADPLPVLGQQYPALGLFSSAPRAHRASRSRAKTG